MGKLGVRICAVACFLCAVAQTSTLWTNWYGRMTFQLWSEIVKQGGKAFDMKGAKTRPGLDNMDNPTCEEWTMDLWGITVTPKPNITEQIARPALHATGMASGSGIAYNKKKYDKQLEEYQNFRAQRNQSAANEKRMSDNFMKHWTQTQGEKTKRFSWWQMATLEDSFVLIAAVFGNTLTLTTGAGMALYFCIVFLGILNVLLIICLIFAGLNLMHYGRVQARKGTRKAAMLWLSIALIITLVILITAGVPLIFMTRNGGAFGVFAQYFLTSSSAFPTTAFYWTFINLFAQLLIIAHNKFFKMKRAERVHKNQKEQQEYEDLMGDMMGLDAIGRALVDGKDSGSSSSDDIEKGGSSSTDLSSDPSDELDESGSSSDGTPRRRLVKPRAASRGGGGDDYSDEEGDSLATGTGRPYEGAVLGVSYTRGQDSRVDAAVRRSQDRRRSRQQRRSGSERASHGSSSGGYQVGVYRPNADGTYDR